MIFLAWGLWVLVYGQFPVKRGVATGKTARLVGIALVLLGGIEWFIPTGYGIVFFVLEIACLVTFYFLLDSDPDVKMK